MTPRWPASEADGVRCVAEGRELRLYPELAP